MTTKAQQIALDNALVAPENQQIKYITDVIVDHLHQPWRTFASIINKCLYGKIYKDNFLTKDKSISVRNRMSMHTARDDSLLGSMRFVSRHKDTQIYGALLPKEMTNQAMLDSVAYNTYYAIASGVDPPKPEKTQKKSDLAISSEETSSKKKPAKAKKDVTSTKKPTTKPKQTKKKAPVKADRGKGLNVISEVVLSEAAQLNEATKQSKKDSHISHASGSGDGTDFESGVLDEQRRKISSTDERTGTKPGVPDVPKYDSESKKKYWGDSGKEDDDDEDNSEDVSDDDKGNDDDGDSDDNDDDNDDEKTESDNDENPKLNHSNVEQEEKEHESERVYTPPKFVPTNEEEKSDDEEKMDEEEYDITKELYKDVNMNLGNTDADMTNADWGGSNQQNASQESGFEYVEEDVHKLLNFENPSPVDNEIASLMDTTICHEETSSQTSSLYTVPVTAILEITFAFIITIPPPPPFSMLFHNKQHQQLQKQQPHFLHLTSMLKPSPQFLLL
ncbi:hypothetical protein Tco_0797165 [Tanacetum coccineum]